ncbi:MAG: DNA-binding protein [Actinomycetota bacterium]|nr:DNA-binding protein [Actinomycetota bacterium]
MRWLDRERERLYEQAVRRQNAGYPSPMGRVLSVPDEEWLSQFEAAERLGIGMFRVGVLIANGHLVAAENATGQAGVTGASVEREQHWRSSAGIVRRAGRLIRDVVNWF